MHRKATRLLPFFLLLLLLAPAMVTVAKDGGTGWLNAKGALDDLLVNQQSPMSTSLLMVILALATFVSEDLTCVAAGLLVARGVVTFMPAASACFLGILVGDALLYLAGRALGPAVLARAPFRWWISKDSLISSEAWFNKRGPIVVIVSRFVPGSRLPVFVAAGVLRMPFWKLMVFFSIAGLLWTPLLVYVSTQIGVRAEQWLAKYEHFAGIGLFVVAFLIWLFVKLVEPLLTKRGRKLLVGKFRRITHWEFWPLWAFYPPVVLHVLYLALKHRGLTVFSAANPGIKAGGFIGESKTGILDSLRTGREFIARYELVPDSVGPEEKLVRVENFMRESSLSFPVVLKPDQGQRGEGVSIVRSRDDIQAYFRKIRQDVIVQEYAPGREFGVFYYRYPDEISGHILSVTEKVLPVVKGDGERTLEQLILNDRRAVSMSAHYFAVNADRLTDVIPAGEEYRLVEIGTHCRGAIFLNGGWILTDELKARIDEISHGFKGFYFGRYDLMAEDIDSLRRGDDFRIVEVNGVTSEATHIYDPDNSLYYAYSVLRKQWRTAFEIGSMNRTAGYTVSSFREMCRMLADYKAAPDVQ
ncbi:MAG: VTT domain-containing protein [Verrucomicrobia bacterium]|nr:VTT domain-containing protein [Verrucomicrobiota bacterium]